MEVLLLLDQKRQQHPDAGVLSQDHLGGGHGHLDGKRELPVPRWESSFRMAASAGGAELDINAHAEAGLPEGQNLH